MNTRLYAVLPVAILAALVTPALADPVVDPNPGRTFCEVYLDTVQHGGCTYDETAPEQPPARGQQTVRGEITTPLGSAVTLVGAAPVTTRSEPANGVSSWTFDVAPNTVGGRFVLDARTHANFDIVFYDDGYGVNHRQPRPTGAFFTSGVEGERGTVPARSAVAVVTIAEGSLGNFVYTATPRGR